jgi:galactokinase
LQSVTDVIGKALDQCCKNISSHKQATGVRLCQAGVGG